MFFLPFLTFLLQAFFLFFFQSKTIIFVCYNMAEAAVFEIVNNTWHINRKDFEVKQR